MARTYKDSLKDVGVDETQLRGFRQVLADHKTIFKEKSKTLLNVTATEASRHRGDLYGLLAEKNIPMDHWYAYQLINDILHPSLYKGLEQHILIPDSDLFTHLLQTYKTIQI